MFESQKNLNCQFFHNAIVMKTWVAGGQGGSEILHPDCLCSYVGSYPTKCIKVEMLLLHVPWFPHLWNRGNNVSYHPWLLYRLNVFMHVKFLEHHQACNKFSVKWALIIGVINLTELVQITILYCVTMDNLFILSEF